MSNPFYILTNKSDAEFGDEVEMGGQRFRVQSSTETEMLLKLLPPLNLWQQLDRSIRATWFRARMAIWRKRA